MIQIHLLKKPFATMSKNPGIGNNYIQDEQNRNYFNGSQTSHTRIKGGYIQPIGRYYKDKIWPEEINEDGIRLYPKERTECNRKTKRYINEKNEKEWTKEVEAATGDIQAAETKIREQRRRDFENAIRLRKAKQLKDGGKL